MRRLGHYAQMLQSHATAYFYLVVPEMLFGMDAAPEQRNLLGLIEADPALMQAGDHAAQVGSGGLKTVFGKTDARHQLGTRWRRQEPEPRRMRPFAPR